MRNVLILAATVLAASVAQAGPLGDFAEGIGACPGGRCPLPRRAESAAVPSPINFLAPALLPPAPVVQSLVAPTSGTVQRAAFGGVWRPFSRLRVVRPCRR